MSDVAPRLSIGLAVRNGQGRVERCVESILRQDFRDFELVISDNVSSDKTVDVLTAYARDDERIRFSANPTNIGVHENMNRVLRMSRGEFFRWISHDDWLEQGCLSTCVGALDANAAAIGVTTGFTLHTASGEAKYVDHPGEVPDADDAARRFERMLWFYHAGDAIYDPIYGVFRRSVMMETKLLRPSEQTDWLLCAELALKGPIVHLPGRLANRRTKMWVGLDRKAFRSRLDPVRGEELRAPPRRTYRDLLDIANAAGLSKSQLTRCRGALRRFWRKEAVSVTRAAIVDARHRWLRG